jgi:hypothetical protein
MTEADKDPNPETKLAREKLVAGQKRPEVELERHNFQALVLANPNYFGNVKGGPKPVKPMTANVSYEELKCVGFNPQMGRIEAVVHIKKDYGYKGGVCSNGSPEYVRFFLSFDNGATWEDLGSQSFKAFDISGKKPLEYAVTQKVDQSKWRKRCSIENLPKLRAILSWNQLPPADDPDFSPVWGNVLNARIQIDVSWFFKIADLPKLWKFELPPDLVETIDLSQTVTAAKPKPLSPAELQVKYKEKAVPEHRFLYPYLLTAEAPLVPGGKGLSKELGIDIAKLITKLSLTDGDTSYEELKCIGLNPNQDCLVGTITVKKPNGYSGNLCQHGSTEYVAFWKWDDIEQVWLYLGTTSVRVHDIKSIPAEGLQYSVFLPVDLSMHRRPCTQGATVLRIRAIASWQAAPPPYDPDWKPVWGNREETLIHVKPGPSIGEGHKPFLSSVGDVAEIDIDASGKANGSCIHTGLPLRDSPFGGRITLAGHIANPVPGLKYRVMRKVHGTPDTSYVPMTNEPTGLGLVLNTWDLANGWLQQHITRHADSEGYYPFEDYAWNHSIEGSIMGVWYSNLGEDGNTYDLRIDVSVDGIPAHDLHSNVVTVLVDNTTPDADLKIDLGGGVVCAHFKPGATFTGTFKAIDTHFKSFSFGILPAGPAHGALPVPSSGVSTHYGGAIADPGVPAGTYSLNTGPMDNCGYALILHVYDRTNVNSGGGYHYNFASVGFCVGPGPSK